MQRRTDSPEIQHEETVTSGDAIGVKPDRHLTESRIARRFGMAVAAALIAVVTATTAEAALMPGAEVPSPREQAAERIVAEAVTADYDWDSVEPMPSVLPQGLAASAPEPQKVKTEIGPVLDHDAAPVSGLDATQMANAITIIEVGMDRGLGERAWAVALATAMQEAKLYNAANPVVPASYEHAWEVEYSDHDSVGIFQQRPSMGWGSVAELMDPATSAAKFYGTLEGVSGWQDMSIAAAAQSVQISAFPDYYAQWEDLAWRIIDAAVR
ncbi:hypothetical protein L0U85_19065 [Glycomyces sp. L485]|uniref:hypothetical protein n=1 Tax=Glycomyces sp. L485 TaxID=2909235 RepID=UPI001F4B64BD|nr:hypothetical protein [Glycomyces sp. L485]MCH7232936.1 hypothetical protein [Glycomyces sp. L485]